MTAKKATAVLAAAFFMTAAAAEVTTEWPYDPSPLYPFGRPNPEQKDPEARIFDPMIGVHECRHKRTDYATGKTSEADALWSWYYDMNGHGIRDIYRFGDGAPASQRVYDPQAKQWHVWYFTGQNFYYAGDWVGGAEGDKLVFRKENEDIGGRPMLSQLEYYDVSEDGFKWRSKNIDNETGDVFVDWEITCHRRAY